MFTLRTLGGIGLFLAGGSWLWLTPAFAGQDVTKSGPWWVATSVLSFVTVALFLAATWALFTRHSWWETLALAGAALGLISLVPYWVAASTGGEAVFAVVFETLVHVLMVGIVFVLLLVPSLEQWVDHQVMGT